MSEMHRASGEMICKECGREYWRHPFDLEHLSWDDRPFLRKLCDGTLVKL